MGLNLENVEFKGKKSKRGTTRAVDNAMIRVSRYGGKSQNGRITIAIYDTAMKKYNLYSHKGLYVACKDNYIILKPSNELSSYMMSKSGKTSTIMFGHDGFNFVLKDSVYILPEHISVQNGYIVIDYMSALDKETSSEIAPVKLTKQQFIDKELKSAYYYVSQGIDAHNQPIQSTSAYLSGARTRAERDWLLYSKEN